MVEADKGYELVQPCPLGIHDVVIEGVIRGQIMPRLYRKRAPVWIAWFRPLKDRERITWELEPFYKSAEEAAEGIYQMWRGHDESKLPAFVCSRAVRRPSLKGPGRPKTEGRGRRRRRRRR